MLGKFLKIGRFFQMSLSAKTFVLIPIVSSAFYPLKSLNAATQPPPANSSDANDVQWFKQKLEQARNKKSISIKAIISEFVESRRQPASALAGQEESTIIGKTSGVPVDRFFFGVEREPHFGLTTNVPIQQQSGLQRLLLPNPTNIQSVPFVLSRINTTPNLPNSLTASSNIRYRDPNIYQPEGSQSPLYGCILLMLTQIQNKMVLLHPNGKTREELYRKARVDLEFVLMNSSRLNPSDIFKKFARAMYAYFNAAPFKSGNSRIGTALFHATYQILYPKNTRVIMMSTLQWKALLTPTDADFVKLAEADLAQTH